MVYWRAAELLPHVADDGRRPKRALPGTPFGLGENFSGMQWTVTNRAGAHGCIFRRALAACTALVGITACLSSSEDKTSRAPVVLVGDSLAAEAADYLPSLLAPRTFVPKFMAGTAPCDWLDEDLAIAPTAVVVMSFTGNSGTPCMGDGAGGFLNGQAIVDKYRTDVNALIELARNAGASVLLVAQPARVDDAAGNGLVDGLNAVYAELANGDDVALVDAGAAVENPDGTFAVVLPCIPNEPQCDPSGSNVVRSDDGVHFCPGPPPPPGPCPTYKSGAFRFAKAIADAVLSL